MFLKNIYHLFLIIAYSILFSGCYRVVDWAKDTFYQGREIECQLSLPRSYIRSRKIYDQFNTLGIFNALWLSEDVIRSYVQLHSKKYELNPDDENIILEEELKKAGGHISFYVLAYDPNESISPIEVPNKYEDAPWNITLEIDGKVFNPFRIKAGELSSEYELIFGKCMSKFKVAYFVQFLSNDQNCHQLINCNTKCISLCFSSLKDKVCLIWNIK